ncbi:hypothetical protein H8S77_14030 [Parabacteroides sp. BX2]|jgi:hypothetical protein|uniref:Fibrobacter succinogenes major paralogous domain-containing protein n=1 Tax=Parabacteroides segnis TaxID=2763058 RepID=A0ABR7E4E7_9BACT|nr:MULTISPECIES: hypothetical protein [Parabacteroides]MBC5643999.1 hypothetical protein [Parabacteroides segnis]MCM0714298.1 hypothetical protein [Parabacteroides sp. TA-V-105]
MKYSITSFILSLLFLCACNEEEISRKTDPLPDGVMRLSATIRNGVKTRALGAPLSDATADEKRVDRLAFFVHTEAEGLQIYPPAPEASVYPTDPNKVHLVDNGDGTYTANVDLTAGGGYEADVVAVANLPEDYDYSQIVTWQGLLDSVTVATATMPLCTGEYAAGKKNAFVMYASATVALHKEKEAEISFAMERLVARIDITNKAYGTDRNAFVLTGARILQAKPASYVTPHDLYASPEVVTVSDWRLDNTLIKLYKGEVTTDNETTEAAADAVCQAAWHALYTYENDDVSHAPTCLEVTGTMNGATITRKIPFEVTDADGITKNPVPIVRNHRYLVQINPAPGQTDISYKLTVDEWNAVDTVNVQPNQDQVPVISNYACAAATNTFGTFDALTGMPDTIVVPATGGTISFTASCPFDTRVTMDYASSDDGNGWLEVTSRSEAVVTKAESSLARTYEITVKPNVGLDATLVNRGYLYIANGANGSVMDTVTIYQGENIAYGETRFAAIPMGQVSGKDVIWAPVNVGATEIATQIKKDADIITDEEKAANERQCGYYFQWGRKVPFRYGGEPGDLAPSGVVLSTYENATKSDYEYATKFIMNSAAWFSDYAVFGKNWPKENDPCPAGWRVPTKEELQIVFDQTPAIDGTTGIWTSAATPAFVLPAGGDRRFDSGLSESRGGSAIYWSATLEGGKAYRLNTDPLLDKRDIAPGYLVRCVKE